MTTASMKRINEQMKNVSTIVLGEKNREQMALAIGSVKGGDRMARIVMTQIRKTPKLVECSVSSILESAMMCCQLNLEPGFGLCSLIPRKLKGNMLAMFEIEYRGMVQLLWRSGMIASVQAEVVYENDFFDYSLGHPFRLEHRPATADRGERTHVYCIITTTTGGTIPRVMNRQQIEEVRDRFSQAYKAGGGPWETDPDPMWCKTVIKRCVKLAPISAEVQMAVTASDLFEAGKSQTGVSELEIDQAAMELDALNKLDQITAEEKAKNEVGADEGDLEPAPEAEAVKEGPAKAPNPRQAAKAGFEGLAKSLATAGTIESEERAYSDLLEMVDKDKKVQLTLKDFVVGIELLEGIDKTADDTDDGSDSDISPATGGDALFDQD